MEEYEGGEGDQSEEEDDEESKDEIIHQGKTIENLDFNVFYVDYHKHLEIMKNEAQMTSTCSEFRFDEHSLLPPKDNEKVKPPSVHTPTYSKKEIPSLLPGNSNANVNDSGQFSKADTNKDEWEEECKEPTVELTISEMVDQGRPT